jgi:hypothetical protein
MGNIFGAGEDDLYLSNGATDVFLDVLTLAGCALARTPWERHLVLFLADRHRWGLGTAGFDLDELPWSEEWPAERAFLVRVIDLALTRHGWDRLAYEPPYAIGYLHRYRELVAGFTPTPVEPSAWRAPPAEPLLARCGIHDLYAGEFGCRLCDPDIQPR